MTSTSKEYLIDKGLNQLAIDLISKSHSPYKNALIEIINVQNPSKVTRMWRKAIEIGSNGGCHKDMLLAVNDLISKEFHDFPEKDFDWVFIGHIILQKLYSDKSEHLYVSDNNSGDDSHSNHWRFICDEILKIPDFFDE